MEALGVRRVPDRPAIAREEFAGELTAPIAPCLTGSPAAPPKKA